MKFKKVPLIKEPISAIGFGCWATGGSSAWNNSDDAASVRAIRKAIDLGVNFFDVAPIYGAGHAETVLGDALGPDRQKVLIASKVGIPWDEPKGCRIDLSPRSVMNEIDLSLSRLKTDRIDLYQLHWPDPQTPIEDTMGTLCRIKDAGKIRYIGLSNHSIALMQRARRCAPIASFQGLYNLLERNPTYYHKMTLEYLTEKDIIPYCKEHGLAFLPYSPLFQGLLTGSFKEADNFNAGDVRADNPKLNGELFKRYFAVVRELEKFAREIGRPLNQIAINWLVNQAVVTSVIAGAQNERHVQDNVASLDWELSAGHERRIDSILAAGAIL